MAKRETPVGLGPERVQSDFDAEGNIGPMFAVPGILKEFKKPRGRFHSR